MLELKQMNEPTEFEKKAKEFLDKYGELVKEFNIDIATYPVFVPDGQGGFRVIMQTTPVDMTKQGKPSPFIEQAK